MSDVLPADWLQPADRRTPLLDPVLTVRQLGRFGGLPRRPLGRADSALVLTSPKGSYQVFLPPRRPGRTDLTRRADQVLYEVDLGIHHLRITDQLPSSDDLGAFRVSVDVNWRVGAPDLVISSGLRNVPALVEPRIRQRMRAVSRGFAADFTLAAERAVQEALDTHQVARAEGLVIACTVHLDLDDAAQSQKAEIRRLAYRHETHPLTVRDAKESAELIAQKAEFYQYYLARDGVAGWALRLAEHPDDLPNALAYLRDGQQQLISERIDIVRDLLKNEHIEKYQLEEPVRAALKAITVMFGTPDAAPPLPVIGPRAPRLEQP